ncbi:hypothetical protein GWI33_011701, partial [Rhynchophorus ferrugineus]
MTALLFCTCLARRLFWMGGGGGPRSQKTDGRRGGEDGLRNNGGSSLNLTSRDRFLRAFSLLLLLIVGSDIKGSPG